MPLYELFKAFILGLVEGATEFIPVSSTGHLILAEDALNFHGRSAETFAVFIQLGAILAIAWVYRERIFSALFTFVHNEDSRRLVINLFVAFLPAAIIGLLTHRWIKEQLFNPFTVAAALVVGGVVILIVERYKPRTRIPRVDDIPLFTALGIGLAQVLALVPGVSRSGATIMGAYGLGCSRVAATEFSFFLALPVMLAASTFDLWQSRDLLTMGDIPVFAVGFVTAFVSALVVVKAFLAFVSRHSFVGFAWYRIIVGAILLAYYGFYHLNG